jgi:hypothetical protein
MQKEIQMGKESNFFNKEVGERNLLNQMLELVYKSNQLIDIINPND